MLLIAQFLCATTRVGAGTRVLTVVDVVLTVGTGRRVVVVATVLVTVVLAGGGTLEAKVVPGCRVAIVVVAGGRTGRLVVEATVVESFSQNSPC